MAKAPDPKDPRSDLDKAKARVEARKIAKAFNDYRITIYVGDQVYAFRAGDVTARHVAKLRAATGSDRADPVLYLLVSTSEDVWALDLVAELIYLARLQAGEDVTFGEVADGLPYDADIRLHVTPGEMPAPPEEVPFPGPLASGEPS